MNFNRIQQAILNNVGLLLVLMVMSGCYNVLPDTPKTDTWRCVKQFDCMDATWWGKALCGNTVVQVSRTLEGNKEETTGTLTTAGVTYQAKYKLVGVNKVWYYESQGRDLLFAILPSGEGVSGGVRNYGESYLVSTKLWCIHRDPW